MNKDNLRPPRNTSEARERGEKGGKKSGEVRRKKRDFQAAARYILDLSANEADTASAHKLGFTGKVSQRDMVLLAQLKKARDKADTAAAAFLRDSAGEKPVERNATELTLIDDPLAEILNQLREK